MLEAAQDIQEAILAKEPRPPGTYRFWVQEVGRPSTSGAETVLLAGTRSRRLHTLLEERRAQQDFIVDDEDSLLYDDLEAESEEDELFSALEGLQRGMPASAPVLMLTLGEVRQRLASRSLHGRQASEAYALVWQAEEDNEMQVDVPAAGGGGLPVFPQRPVALPGSCLEAMVHQYSPLLTSMGAGMLDIPTEHVERHAAPCLVLPHRARRATQQRVAACGPPLVLDAPRQ